MSGCTNRIVTEIIIDADQAELSLAQLAAAQRAAQREFDKTTADNHAEHRRHRTGGGSRIDAADALTITAGALRKARAEFDAYLGRMDPLIFAQTSLSREIGKVGQAIKGVDTLLIAQEDKRRRGHRAVETTGDARERTHRRHGPVGSRDHRSRRRAGVHEHDDGTAVQGGERRSPSISMGCAPSWCRWKPSKRRSPPRWRKLSSPWTRKSYR